MKSLQESLFDKDLDKKDLMSNTLKKFEKRSLSNIPAEELTKALKYLWSVGTHCDEKYLLKRPVDLTKQIILSLPDSSYEDLAPWYLFAYMTKALISGSKKQSHIIHLLNLQGQTFTRRNERISEYDWHDSQIPIKDDMPWDDVVYDIIRDHALRTRKENDVIFSILDKKTSADLIKQIEKR